MTKPRDSSWHDGWHSYHPCDELHTAWPGKGPCPSVECDCCEGLHDDCGGVVSFYIVRDPEAMKDAAFDKGWDAGMDAGMAAGGDIAEDDDSV